MKIDFKDKNIIYIIAEIGMTHDGSLGLALNLLNQQSNLAQMLLSINGI